MRHVSQTAAHELSLPRTNEAPLVLITSWGGREETSESLMFQGLLVGLTVVQLIFRHVVDKHSDDEEKKPLEWWCRSRERVCARDAAIGRLDERGSPLTGPDVHLPSATLSGFTFPPTTDWLLKGVLNLESHSLQLLTGSPA